MDGIYISTVRLGYSRTLPIGPFFLYFLMNILPGRDLIVAHQLGVSK
jgi:hypothetical protein